MKGMGMNKEVYIISKDYLEQLLESSGRTLVGMALQKFELSNSLPDIKLQVKETIYQEFRNIKKLLDAHQNGVEQSQWVFLAPKKG
jgi:hypothetical protein